MARRNNTKKTNRTATFEGVGKSFEAEQEYLITCTECEVEESDNGFYYSMKLEGTGEFEGSIMYNNASLVSTALWRTRPVFEAFLGEVPEGDFNIDEYAEKFVGKKAMCSTFKDSYNGQTRIKPEDFWAAEGADEDDGEAGEIDLDELDDDDIKKIGKALKIKSKRASTIREELEEADEDELLAVLEKLGLIDSDDEDDEDDGEAGEIDLDELDDDDIKALAKAAGMRVSAKSRVNTLKKKLAELDEDELAEAAEEAGIGGDSDSDDDSKGGGDGITADDIAGMNQDELEELVEEHDLDVDLDDHKTLRKKRTAVTDAAEEAGILEED